MADNLIRKKRIRDKRKREGLCTNCGGEREIPERIYCQKCTDRNRVRNK
jgi:hypothetical protein